jgi:hypothetical protein
VENKDGAKQNKGNNNINSDKGNSNKGNGNKGNENKENNDGTQSTRWGNSSMIQQPTWESNTQPA